MMMALNKMFPAYRTMEIKISFYVFIGISNKPIGIMYQNYI